MYRRLAEADPDAFTARCGAPEECDCPACSGDDVDLAQLLDGLLDDVATLAECQHLLDAELAGAALVAVVTVAGDELVPASVQGFIPRVEAEGGGSALALVVRARQAALPQARWSRYSTGTLRWPTRAVQAGVERRRRTTAAVSGGTRSWCRFSPIRGTRSTRRGPVGLPRQPDG